MKPNRGGLWKLRNPAARSLAMVVCSVLVLGLAAPALALHETETVEEPIVTKLIIDGEVRLRDFYDVDNWRDDSAGPGHTGYDCRVQLGVISKLTPPTSGYVRLEPTYTLAPAWSKGYWKNAKNLLRSTPFAEGESTWYVDGKTADDGWNLVFTAKPGPNPIVWYRKKQIANGANATTGYPGDIMIVKLGSSGHAAYVIDNDYWNGMRAWTVRHADWADPDHTGQTWAETINNVRIDQCTFVEYRPGRVKVLDDTQTALTDPDFPLIGFIHPKVTPGVAIMNSQILLLN